MSTGSNAFSSKLEPVVVESFKDMEEIILVNDEVEEVLVQAYFDKSILEIILNNLLIWDIKLSVSKSVNGWLFQVERGVYNL